MKQIRKIINWFINVFWKKPTSIEKPKAKEVINNYICVKYHNQWINLKKSEVNKWNAMGRYDRRGMANRFKNLEKKGFIKFIEINGNMTCVKNKDYENEKND